MTALTHDRRDLIDWMLMILFAWSLAGLFWTPYDPQAQAFLGELRAGPSAAHLLGVDSLGRDVLSRVWKGAGHTVLLGGAASAGTLAIASILLWIEQQGPRFLKTLIRSLISAGLAMPVLLVGLILLVFLQPSSWTLVAACAIGGVPFGFRQLHVVWSEQSGAVYALASRSLGASRWHLVWFTLWPNVRPQAVSLAKLMFAVGVLELSGLTFLGLTGDPDFPELGTILRQNQADLFLQPLLVLWPGALLSGLLLLVHISNIRSGAGSRRPSSAS
ncbi:MAG TPA: ABC transporter permease subunit [Opitutaceae bacterium]